MTQQTKVTMTPAQLMLRVVGVAFASVVLFALLAVLGSDAGTAEAADHPPGLGGDRPVGNVPAPAAELVRQNNQPPTPGAPAPGPPSNVPGLQNPIPAAAQIAGPVVPPVADIVGHVVPPVADAITPIIEPVVPVTEVVEPGAEVVVPVVTPVDPIAAPAVPVAAPAGPIAAPAGPVAAPASGVAAPTGGVQPVVDPVVPPTADTLRPPAGDPAVTDGDPATSGETTTAPDPTEGPAAGSVVEEVAFEAAVAVPGATRSSVVTSASAVPAAHSDAVRDTTGVGYSSESSDGRTTSGPYGPFPAGSNAPGVLPSIVSGLLSGASSSSSRSGGAPVAMLAVLTATAAAMFMLSRRVTTEVAWRSALVLSSVERPG